MYGESGPGAEQSYLGICGLLFIGLVVLELLGAVLGVALLFLQ